MDLILHLIDGVVIIGDFEWLAIDLEWLETLIDQAVSKVDLSDKLLEFIRAFKLNNEILSI